MHQEHLYEYFRFIRNNDHIMAILQNYLKGNITNYNDNNIITKIHLMIHNPGQEVRTGSGGKTPEIAGTWKQYSVRIFSDNFRPIPAGNHRKLAGIHRKKSG
jgi:hypothetical protein